jgi:hypothetical protein
LKSFLVNRDNFCPGTDPKNERKVKAIALLFLPFFLPFSKMKKVAKNGRKV